MNGNVDVLPVLLPFSTFCNFSLLSFSIRRKNKSNEIKCNSCYIHTSGRFHAFAIFWASVGRGIRGDGVEQVVIHHS